MESTDQADPSCFYFRISWVPNYVFSNEDFKFLVKSFHTQFLKESMFKVSEALHKVEGTKKIKTTSLHHEILK